MSSRHLRLAVCPDCGHAVATHEDHAGARGLDYHAQYDTSTFLDALSLTRRRQGRHIVDLARRLLPGANRWIDFGAGRGFLLDAARDAGFDRLLGLDSSALAIQLLRERGFEAECVDSGSVELPARVRAFRPDLLSLLDVIEHFPAMETMERLRALTSALEPLLVIVKVPVSQGLLYRLACAAASLGVPGPLEQLYQVGTDPPHQSYFSRRSLSLLIERAGLELVHVERERDFDAAGFGQRVRLLSRFGRAGDVLGWIAENASEQFGLEDSLIVFAKRH